MDFSEKLFVRFKRDANYTLAFISRIAALLMLAVVVLTACGVFILGKEIYPAIVKLFEENFDLFIQVHKAYPDPV